MIEFWILCSVITAVIGALKGGHSLRWLLIGCVLGPFGVILAAFMPSQKTEKRTIAVEPEADEHRPSEPFLESEVSTISAKEKDL